MSKRLIALALGALAAVVLWRWVRREPEAEPAPETINVPGVGRVRLEPDKRKRDAWQAWADRRAREAGNGNVQ